MSFILRFFHEPKVHTVNQAVRFADQDHSPSAEPNQHYLRFVQSISEYFPDLSEDEAMMDRNLWPEGLDDSPCHDVVINLLINLDMLDVGVMTVIAQHAHAADLNILDEQNGLFYFDLKVIGIRDKTPRPLPAVTPYAKSVMTENVRGLLLRDSQQRVADALAHAMQSNFQRSEGDSRSILSRRHGDVQQIISLSLTRSTDRRRARLYIQLGFACETLRAQWLPLLPYAYVERLKNYDSMEGGVAMDLLWYLSSIIDNDPSQSVGLQTDSDMTLGNVEQRELLNEKTRAWAPTKLLPFIDQIRTVDDLSDRFLNDAALEYCKSRRVAFPIYPTMLTLARRKGLDAFDAYVNAYRSNGDLKRISALFKDPSCAHFEQLVSRLRGQ